MRARVSPRIADMPHGRCSAMAYGDARVTAILGAPFVGLCGCPGFEAKGTGNEELICAHCGHIRLQHNRPPRERDIAEVE